MIFTLKINIRMVLNYYFLCRLNLMEVNKKSFDLLINLKRTILHRFFVCKILNTGYNYL